MVSVGQVASEKRMCENKLTGDECQTTTLIFDIISSSAHLVNHIRQILYLRLKKLLRTCLSIFPYKGITSLSPDPFFAFLFSFRFVRDTNLAHPIKKLFTSPPLLKRKGLYTNATDLRQNSADRPFNLSLCGFC